MNASTEGKSFDDKSSSTNKTRSSRPLSCGSGGSNDTRSKNCEQNINFGATTGGATIWQSDQHDVACRRDMIHEM